MVAARVALFARVAALGVRRRGARGSAGCSPGRRELRRRGRAGSTAAAVPPPTDLWALARAWLSSFRLRLARGQERKLCQRVG